MFFGILWLCSWIFLRLSLIASVFFWSSVCPFLVSADCFLTSPGLSRSSRLSLAFSGYLLFSSALSSYHLLFPTCYGAPWRLSASSGVPWLSPARSGSLRLPSAFLGFSIVFSDFLWFLLSLCGSVWLSSALSGSLSFSLFFFLWFALALCGSLLLSLAIDESFWLFLVSFGFLRRFLVLSGLVSLCLALPGSLWPFRSVSRDLYSFLFSFPCVYSFIRLSVALFGFG